MIVLLISGLVLSAYFCGIGSAFVNADKLRLELDRKNGAAGSEIIRLFTDHHSQYISAMQIGNMISIVIFVLAFSGIFTPALQSSINSGFFVIALEIVISAFIIVLIDNFFAKPVFSASPNLFLKYLSVPSLFFFLLLYFLSKLIRHLAGLILGSPSGTSDEDSINDIAFRRIDSVGNLITSNLTEEELSDNQNIAIFRNALDFSNVKLREIMVPRTEIEAVPITSSVDQLKEKFVSTRFSRILVFNDSIDNITGYFEVKDIFKNPSEIKVFLRKLLVVPETMSASRLLKRFVSERKNIALVVDEFGGTSGMVTIEDLLEEIVGDIEDEHDTSDLVEKSIRPNEFIFSGRLEIDYLNERYGLGLPENDEYETLAGMILYYHGSIPGNNDIIKVGNLIFKVLRASNTRIELVNFRIE